MKEQGAVLPTPAELDHAMNISTPTNSARKSVMANNAIQYSDDDDDDDDVDEVDAVTQNRRNSTAEIFKLANQSIDEMLNEIQAKSPGINIYSQRIDSSPSTEPLSFNRKSVEAVNVENQEEEDDEEDTTTEDLQKGGFETSLLRSDSMTFLRRKSDSIPIDETDFAAKTVQESPSKNPVLPASPKKVTIEMSPPKIISYEQEEYSDEDEDENSFDEDIANVSQSDFIWEAVPVKIDNPKTFGRPLPPIQHSNSDYSINSMPNLPSSKHNLLESPVKSIHSNSDYENDDSEETVVQTPLNSFKHNSKDYSKQAQEFMKLSSKLPQTTQFSDLLDLSPGKNKLDYDHLTYLEESKRGELHEPKDIKINKAKRENFVNELSVVNPVNDTSEQDMIIADLGDMYDENIRNTKTDDSLFLNRNDSVRSAMSIASVDRKLKTVVVNKKMNNIELKDGIKGFSDDIVEELIEEKNTETATYNEEQEEEEEEDDLNVDSGNEQELEQDSEEMEDKSQFKGHGRKSSLSDTMGRFFNSMGDSIKRSFSNNEIAKQAESVTLPKPSTISGGKSKRNFSAQSTSTSITNDSDFVSAEEGSENEEDEQTNGAITTFASQDFKSAMGDNESIIDNSSQLDDTINDDDDKSIIDDNNDNASVHTLEVQEEEEHTHEEVNVTTDSTNYVLEVSHFDDDPFEFSKGFEEFELNSNPSSRKSSGGDHSSGKRVVSNESSSPLSEVSAIWQNQPSYQNLHKVAPSFQSLCDPSSKKKYVFSASHPRSISVKKHRSSVSVFSTRSISPNYEAIKSIVSPDVTTQSNVLPEVGLGIMNPLTEDTTEMSNIAAEEEVTKEVEEKTEDSLESEDYEITHQSEINEPEVSLQSIKVPEEVIKREPEQDNSIVLEAKEESIANNTAEFQDESMSNVFDVSYNLSDIIKEANNSDFLSDLNKWETNDKEDIKDKRVPKEEEVLNAPALKPSNSNDQQVSDIWRTGTVSRKTKTNDTNSIMSGGLSNIHGYGHKLRHLSVDEMEKFMIHKRLASDEFQIKKVGNTAILHDNSFIDNTEQQAMISNNRSAQPFNVYHMQDVNSINSEIIPELGISKGLMMTNNTSKSPSKEVAVETDDIFEHFLKSPTASFSLSDNTRFLELITDHKPQEQEKKDNPLRALATNVQPVIKEQNVEIVKPVSLVKSEVEENKENAIDTESIVWKKLEEPVRLINGEQGRLFMRILGLKDLLLPKGINVNEQNLQFCLVIDNGIHRLTTDFYDVSRVGAPIPINKEFEIIIADQLDLIITVKLKYEKPRDQLVEVVERKKVKSKSFMSRCLGIKDELITTRYVTKPSKEDPFKNSVSNDGSFAKLHIRFRDFKDKIECQAAKFLIDGINEFGMYKDIVNGGKMVKSKPYKVLSLDVSLLYIPRKSEYEVFPNSIKDAYDQVRDINKVLNITHEGYLYQEGGDVEVWQRRFFKLNGFELFAYNEQSMKLRAKINLKKIVDIIYPGQDEDEEDEEDEEDGKDTSEVDDNAANTNDHIAEIEVLQAPNGPLGLKKNGKRVNGGKSISSVRQFSETLILNEGFKIKFANGETINFGADTKESKLEWCDLLTTIVNKNQFKRQPWVKAMAAKDNIGKSMVI